MSWWNKKKEEPAQAPAEVIPPPTWTKLSEHVVRQDYPMRGGVLVRDFNFANRTMTIETVGPAFHEPKYEQPFPNESNLLMKQAIEEMEKLGGSTEYIPPDTRSVAQIVAAGLANDVTAPQKASFARKSRQGNTHVTI